MEWERVVGRNVRRFRKELSMTQERLALEASIDLRYLGGIERGEQNPSVAVLVRLAATLGVLPAAFFDADAAEVAGDS
jgi:transcriptional regulator with XRE-family HTH domain